MLVICPQCDPIRSDTCGLCCSLTWVPSTQLGLKKQNIKHAFQAGDLEFKKKNWNPSNKVLEYSLNMWSKSICWYHITNFEATAHEVFPHSKKVCHPTAFIKGKFGYHLQLQNYNKDQQPHDNLWQRHHVGVVWLPPAENMWNCKRGKQVGDVDVM